MDLARETEEAINSGIEAFKTFIDNKIQETPDFLKQFFWVDSKNTAYTVLDYLIVLHQEDDAKKNLIEFIKYLEQQGEKTLNCGESVHLALDCGKISLAMYLLTGSTEEIDAEHGSSTRFRHFDADKRDYKGRTLLALALQSKQPHLLKCVLKYHPNIFAPSFVEEINTMVQPIHQAITLNYPQGVSILAEEGATLDHCWGVLQETPLLLAARVGSIQAIKALLDCKEVHATLEKINLNGLNAMDALCLHLNKDKVHTIEGIAMLLCCGAEPPSSEPMRDLLRKNRGLLLKAVHNYLENKPELVDSFVNRCHLSESALHNIVYADHSWGNSIRHLFGKPSDAALIIEHLVTRKYTSPQNNQPVTAELLVKEQNPLKLYAEFVRRYAKAYNNQFICNPWSSMRWMIAQGSCDWNAVVSYAQNHPKSRTNIIYKEMFHVMSKVHEEIAQQPLEETLATQGSTLF